MLTQIMLGLVRMSLSIDVHLVPGLGELNLHLKEMGSVIAVQPYHDSQAAFLGQ
jgi:hypothetical protein